MKYKNLPNGAVIDTVPSVVGKNKSNRVNIPGPLTVLDSQSPYLDWNRGFEVMQIQVSAFDMQPTWVTVLPNEDIRVIVGGIK